MAVFDRETTVVFHKEIEKDNEVKFLITQSQNH